MNQEILTKNDIIDVQRNCYGQLEDLSLLSGGVEVTWKVGSMICENSYFDIHKFARLLEERLIDKIATSTEAQRRILARGRELNGHK